MCFLKNPMSMPNLDKGTSLVLLIEQTNTENVVADIDTMPIFSKNFVAEENSQHLNQLSFTSRTNPLLKTY